MRESHRWPLAGSLSNRDSCRWMEQYQRREFGAGRRPSDPRRRCKFWWSRHLWLQTYPTSLAGPPTVGFGAKVQSELLCFQNCCLAGSLGLLRLKVALKYNSVAESEVDERRVRR